MPGGVMRDRLDQALPNGLTITSADLGNSDRAPGEEPHGGWLQVDLADSAGAPAGGINVLLYPPSNDDGDAPDAQTTCPGNLTSYVTCTELHGGGKPIGRASTSDQSGVIVREVTRIGSDGGVVYAAASNSSDEKWGTGSSTDAPAPALTIAQLRHLVADQAWQDWEPKRR
jgi:hypothetical protein